MFLLCFHESTLMFHPPAPSLIAMVTMLQERAEGDSLIRVVEPGSMEQTGEESVAKNVMFAPRSRLEAPVSGSQEAIPPAIRSLLSRKMCRPQNRDRLLRLLLEGRQGDAETLKDVQRIVSRFGNDTVMCRMRHLKGVKLLSNVKHPYSKLGREEGAPSRRTRDGYNATSRFTCTENTTMLNSSQDVALLQAEMTDRQCLDEATNRYISRITQLQGSTEAWGRSSARRVLRLKCQLAKKYRFCRKRAETAARPNATQPPQATSSDDLTLAEVHFLNNWPAPYEIKDRGELEMIFY